MPTVLAVSASASGLAGLNPISLIRPNQKNIRNIENRATGINVRLKNAMSRKSISDILILFLFVFLTISIFSIAPEYWNSEKCIQVDCYTCNHE